MRAKIVAIAGMGAAMAVTCPASAQERARSVVATRVLIAPDILLIRASDRRIPAIVAPDSFGAVRDMMQHRVASAMIDVYPLAGLGLRVSGGTRFYTRRNFAREAEVATNGLLYVPRLPRGGGAFRGDFRGYMPAATVGYTQRLASAVTIGVEGGTLLGRMAAPMPRGARLRGADGARSGLNPLLNLAVALAF